MPDGSIVGCQERTRCGRPASREGSFSTHTLLQVLRTGSCHRASGRVRSKALTLSGVKRTMRSISVPRLTYWMLGMLGMLGYRYGLRILALDRKRLADLAAENSRVVGRLRSRAYRPYDSRERNQPNQHDPAPHPPHQRHRTHLGNRTTRPQVLLAHSPTTPLLKALRPADAISLRR
jgi:hypothetical protein